MGCLRCLCLGTCKPGNDCTVKAACHFDGKVWHVSGVDWGGVEKYVDLTDCYQHYLDPCYVAPKVRIWYLPWTWCYKAERYVLILPRTDSGLFMCCWVNAKQLAHCHCSVEGHEGKVDFCRKKDLSAHGSSHNGSHHMRHTLGKRANRSMNSSGLDSNFTMMEADRVFGRASEWSGPADLESGVGKGGYYVLLRLPCVLTLGWPMFCKLYLGNTDFHVTGSCSGRGDRCWQWIGLG